MYVALVGRTKPYLIDFPKIGDDLAGFISVAEGAALPFMPKRVYWAYGIPEGVVRGEHAHRELEKVVVAVAGVVDIRLETVKGKRYNFRLDSPVKGLFIPKLCWRELVYSPGSVLMCIASLEYAESDYIRSLVEFKSLVNR